MLHLAKDTDGLSMIQRTIVREACVHGSSSWFNLDNHREAHCKKKTIFGKKLRKGMERSHHEKNFPMIVLAMPDQWKPLKKNHRKKCLCPKLAPCFLINLPDVTERVCPQFFYITLGLLATWVTCCMEETRLEANTLAFHAQGWHHRHLNHNSDKATIISLHSKEETAPCYITTFFGIIRVEHNES